MAADGPLRAPVVGFSLPPSVPPSSFLVEQPSTQWTLVPPKWQELSQGCDVCLGSRNWPRLILLVILLSCIIAASQLLDITVLEGLVAYLEKDVWRGGLIFVAFTVGANVVMFPGAVLSLTAGAIFGLYAGSALAVTGTILGQTLTFCVGRFLLRDIVAGFMTQQWPKWAAVDAAVSQEGWKLIALLRLSPIIPWNVLNYALSVTGVSLTAFTLSSAAAIVPWTVTLAYFGSLAKSMADVFNGASLPEGATQYFIFIASGLTMVVTAAYTTIFSRRALSKALAETGETGQDIVDELDSAALVSPRGGLGSPLGSSDRYWCAPLGPWHSSALDNRSSLDVKSPFGRRVAVQRVPIEDPDARRD